MNLSFTKLQLGALVIVVISYPSLPADQRRSSSLNNRRWWDKKHEQDMIDLSHFKETNISSSSSSSSYSSFNDIKRRYEIESSMLEIEEYQQENRQFVYGTCTCSSTSLNCGPFSQLSIITFPVCAYAFLTSPGCTITSCPSVTYYFSSCSATSTCSTVCSSVSITGSCSQSCITFTSLSAIYYTSASSVSLFGPAYGTSTGGDGIITSCQWSGTSVITSTSSTSSVSSIYSTGCNTLTSTICTTTTSLVVTTSSSTVSSTNRRRIVAIAAAVAVAAAVAIAVGIGVGVPAVQTANEMQQQRDQVLQNVAVFLSSMAPTPLNLLPIPVTGLSFRNDGGCDDGSILFPADGRCHPVLRQGPCPDRNHWLTVDPITLLGRCSPRLCGSGRVFVGRDGLCHNDDDTSECSGGRKLFYSAYGDPICDCPMGQYPFP